ncbi:Lactose permease [Lachnellula suecica]|uniref:Lactose permease n=1 Tax=Lachnellula suecica TaxID=602035 RepID=A0A8T9CD71_9HELO|nr:Lactose permease [Lachnellula suecica]
MVQFTLSTGAVGAFQPKSNKTQGYDSALMTGLNIMPQYTSDLHLNTATLSFNSVGTLVGWGLASFCMGPVVDYYGRKTGIIISILIKLIGILLMTAAQNEPMFGVGRVILGFGSATAAIASSAWLAETLPMKVRGRGLSIIYTVYYVGALICSGVTYATQSYNSSWCWRLPCALQSIFAVLCWFVLWFTPESPRWLVKQGRFVEALHSLASCHSNGDITDPTTLALHKDIVDSMEAELAAGKGVTYSEMFRTKNSRKRITLVISSAVIAMMSGNNVIAYYLGTMLTAAGITNVTTQLEINIILNAWSFVCAIIGTLLMDKLGRKTLCLFACSSMTVFLFVIGALTKGNCFRVFSSSGSSAYTIIEFGTDSTNISGIYGTVAAIFIFQGAYSVGITPLTQLYPPEVLNYSIRSNGMAVWTLACSGFGIFSGFVPSFGLAAIGWKFYMINGCYDVLQVIYVAVYWVETKGLTLEEIDRVMDGKSPRIYDIEGINEAKSIDGVELNDDAPGIRQRNHTDEKGANVVVETKYEE